MRGQTSGKASSSCLIYLIKFKIPALLYQTKFSVINTKIILTEETSATNTKAIPAKKFSCHEYKNGFYRGVPCHEHKNDSYRRDFLP